MTKFAPGPGSEALRTYLYQPDPRYQIRAGWIARVDGTRRVRYRAFYNHCTIGELAPSYRRETVIVELQELIDAGGVGAMADLPDPRRGKDA